MGICRMCDTFSGPQRDSSFGAFNTSRNHALNGRNQMTHPIDEAVAVLRSRVAEAVGALTLESSPPLGVIVRRRRKEMGLSIDQFAHHMGYDRVRVWRLETNKIVNPSLVTVYRLSCVLQMPFTVLASGALVLALGKTDA